MAQIRTGLNLKPTRPYVESFLQNSNPFVFFNVLSSPRYSAFCFQFSLFVFFKFFILFHDKDDAQWCTTKNCIEQFLNGLWFVIDFSLTTTVAATSTTTTTTSTTSSSFIYLFIIDICGGLWRLLMNAIVFKTAWFVLSYEIWGHFLAFTPFTMSSFK